jgi:hypothetical protein
MPSIDECGSVSTTIGSIIDYQIKDSGERSEFDTGAVRDVQTGKGRYDLLPPFAMHDLARHYQKGCEKYGDRNWEKGIPISRYVDSARRHLNEFVMGLTDEAHLIAACWNLMCAYDTLRRIEHGLLPESLDNLPYPLKAKNFNQNDRVVTHWDLRPIPFRDRSEA